MTNPAASALALTLALTGAAGAETADCADAAKLQAAFRDSIDTMAINDFGPVIRCDPSSAECASQQEGFREALANQMASYLASFPDWEQADGECGTKVAKLGAAAIAMVDALIKRLEAGR